MHAALIVGASRGIGYALVETYLHRGWRVVATARAGRDGALPGLRDAMRDRLEIETLDITRSTEIEALAVRLSGRRFELLLVNAGTKSDETEALADVSTDEFARVMHTNALSPMRVVERFAPLVTPDGTIAVMSSGQGSVANNTSGGREVYRASKAALNSLMRSYAARSAVQARTLLLLAPGWIRTDLGGPDAPFGLEEAIPPLVETIEAQRGRPGLRYLDRFGSDVPW